MAKIGNFTKTQDGFEGEVFTLAHTFKATLVRSPSTNPEAPQYRAMAGRADIGAAWEKRANSTGEIYLSVTFDDVSFSNPISGNLVTADGETYDLLWSRPRPKH